MADPKPIKQHIEITADLDAAKKTVEATEDLNRVNEDGTKVTEESARATDKASRASREHSDTVDRQRRATDDQTDSQRQGNDATDAAAATLAGLGAAFLGANGVINLYEQWIERIERASERLRENAAIARENAEARLDFVALQGVETVEQVNAINTAASFAGRRPGEVAQLGTFLASQLPGASPEDINQITLATASAGRTSTAPLTELASGILPLYRQTGDATVASNIYLEAVRQAGEPDAGEFGQILGENIGLIQANAGVDVGEAAGFIAAGTGVGISSRPALTALNAVNFSIRGQGTPRGNEVFERLGITDRSNVLDVLEQIVAANQRGELSTADIEALGGREAAGLFATLADPEIFADFRRRVQAVDAREEFTGDLASDNAEGIFGSSGLQRFNILAKTFEAESEGIRAGDVGAARAESFRTGLAALLDAELAKPGGGAANITPDLAQRIKDEFEFQLGRGLEAEEALRIAEAAPRGHLQISNVPGVPDAPLRTPEGRLVSDDGTTTTRHELDRSHFFSAPLRVLVNRGAPTEPGLLVNQAEVIRHQINQAVIDELGTTSIVSPLTGDPADEIREREIDALGGRRNTFPAGEGQRSVQQQIQDMRAEIERLRGIIGDTSRPRIQEHIDILEDNIEDLQGIDGASQSAAPGIANYGTLIVNAGDPLTDDLDGRDRLGRDAFA